jgi:hypothetical protein
MNGHEKRIKELTEAEWQRAVRAYNPYEGPTTVNGLAKRFGIHRDRMAAGLEARGVKIVKTTGRL